MPELRRILTAAPSALLERAGLAPSHALRVELGRVRSAVAAVATVEREERARIAGELAEVRAEVAEVRAIVRELYTGGTPPASSIAASVPAGQQRRAPGAGL